MDITIQMRSLELLIKMLKRDMEGIPAYGYTRQMGSLPLLSARESLPRCTPEEAGLSSTVVERFFRNLSDNTAELGIHSAMLLRHGKVFAEGYYAPYRPEIPHMLYSASKSVTSTAIGMAVDEGLMDIDERLEDIFPGYAGKPANKWSKNADGTAPPHHEHRGPLQRGGQRSGRGLGKDVHGIRTQVRAWHPV